MDPQETREMGQFFKEMGQDLKPVAEGVERILFLSQRHGIPSALEQFGQAVERCSAHGAGTQLFTRCVDAEIGFTPPKREV